MSWNTLRTQVGTLMSTLTKIHEVSNTPKLTFGGYPAIYIVPSDHESDYETTTENERVYAFLIRVFYETKNTTMAVALNNLEDAVDDIIDAIDREDKKPSSTRVVGVSLPADYTYLAVSAVPSVWGELPSENLIFAEIKIKVRISFDAS